LFHPAKLGVDGKAPRSKLQETNNKNQITRNNKQEPNLSPVADKIQFQIRSLESEMRGEYNDKQKTMN
jgi:hypothetical protein